MLGGGQITLSASEEVAIHVAEAGVQHESATTGCHMADSSFCCPKWLK
jgi:hypothetical protein